VLGGFLTGQFGWRSVFMLQLPLALLAAWLAVTRLTNTARGSPRGFAFDWWGLVLFSLFVAPALLALDQARRLAALPLLVAGGLAVVAGLALWLLLQQERRAPDPLLPLNLLGDATIWRTNLMTGLVNGAFVGAIAFLPIYLTTVRGLSPSEVGFALLPLSACSGFGALMAGAGLARTGRTLLWPAIGLTAATIALVAIAIGAGVIPMPVLAVLLAVASLGFGSSFPMVQVTVQVAAGRERLGSATASVQFSRSLGAATGTALLGAVLFGALVVAPGDAAGLFVALVNQGAAALAGLPPSGRALFQAELLDAFRALFGAAALLTGVAAWLCTRVPLQRV
jgi:predicted MFS family arabinose efflux permease